MLPFLEHEFANSSKFIILLSIYLFMLKITILSVKSLMQSQVYEKTRIFFLLEIYFFKKYLVVFTENTKLVK